MALAALLWTLPLACNKAEPPTPPKETAAPAAESAPKGGSARTLALQKPAGNPLVDREIEALQKVADKAGDKADPWILLGRAWIKKARESADPGYYLNASACADTVLGFEPKSRPARDLRGLVLVEQHAFADALDLAEQILIEDPDDLMALGTKSDALLELGRFDEAVKSAQRMVDLKPNLPSYARAAHLRWLQGDLDAAKSIYRQAMDARDPRDPEPHAWVLVNAAKVFWHEGDIEGADRGFERALGVLSDYPAALVGRARVALAQNDPKRAAELAERAYKKSPLPLHAWVLGDARKAAGDEKGAEEAYALVLKGRSTDPRTVALFLAVKGKDADEALALARKELGVRRDIYTRDTLAWALYRKGQIADARVESEAAIALGTKDASLLYHAGAIRIAAGDSEGGEKLVREALKTNPHFDPTGAAEAKKLLGEETHGAP
ncbi:tetratricopeptide repeat protein [Polyangium aurulentum]|nr:tetratricopeptide repeat protein [Polyangium aurulentum]